MKQAGQSTHLGPLMVLLCVTMRIRTEPHERVERRFSLTSRALYSQDCLMAPICFVVSVVLCAFCVVGHGCFV